MVWPILISVSLAPVSYFFCASAGIVKAALNASTTAAVDLNSVIPSSLKWARYIAAPLSGQPIANQGTAKRGLALQYVTQYVHERGTPDEAFVLFQHQDLDVAQRRQVGIVQIQLPYAVGHSAIERGLAVIIDVQPGKTVL